MNEYAIDTILREWKFFIAINKATHGSNLIIDVEKILKRGTRHSIALTTIKDSIINIEDKNDIDLIIEDITNREDEDNVIEYKDELIELIKGIASLTSKKSKRR